MNTVLMASHDAEQLSAWSEALQRENRWTLLPDAQSLAELRQRLTSHQPALLVCDLVLADGPLADLIRVLRNGGRHQDLRVLAVTRHAQDPQLLSALQAGADSFFVSEGARAQDLAARVADTLAGGADIAPWIARCLLEHFGQEAMEPPRSQVEVLSNPLALVPLEQKLLRQLSAGLRLNDVAAVEGVLPRELTTLVRGIYRKMQWTLRAGDLSLV